MDGDQLLEVFLRGALGRSGRKRSRRAQRFLGGGQGSFLTASTVMAAVGVAWGLFDSLRAESAQAGSSATATPDLPPRTANTASDDVAGRTSAAAPLVVPPAVARIVRLAASAAVADGAVTDAERAVLLRHARDAGVESMVEEELTIRRPLAEIVAGATGESERRDLYVLAYTMVRADDSVSGAERIYLAQLAHALGLDAPTVAGLEQQTARAIDDQPDVAPPAS